MKNFRKKTRETIKGFVKILIKPFIFPLIIVCIILILCTYISEVLCLAFDFEIESNIKEELKYYAKSDYTEQDKNDFMSSIEDFTSNFLNQEEVYTNTEWPVLGVYTISSYFGYRTAPTSGASTYHTGIDIVAKEGEKLICIMNGEVIKASWGGAGGYTITIKSDEYTYSYCHVSPRFLVVVGEKVFKGQVIGQVGPKNVYNIPNNPYKDKYGNPTNGASTGCHCHFMIRKNGELINPLTILKKVRE